MNIYIVKSGQLIDFSGWEWENIKVFSDYTKAKKFADKLLKQLKNHDLEDIEIEELILEI